MNSCSTDGQKLCLDVCSFCLSCALMHTSIGRIKLQRWRHGTSECMPIGRLHKADFKLSTVKVASPFNRLYRRWSNWNPASVVDHKRGPTFPAHRLSSVSVSVSPSSSAAWVVHQSYSQVKLWPFNGTYCKGIRWPLSRGTNSFITPWNESARFVVHAGPISDPGQSIWVRTETVCMYQYFLGCVAQLIQLLFDKYPAYPLHMHVSDL